MPISRCPACRSSIEIDASDLGHDVECPTCAAVFTAGDDSLPTVLPARARRRRDDDDDDEDDRPRRRSRRRDDPEDLIAEARQAIFMPALFSIIIAGLGIVLAIGDMAMLVAMGPQALKANPLFAALPMEALIAVRIVAVLWESVILAGSISMIRMKAYGFAKTAMVLAMIPFAGFCCVLGIWFGAWGFNLLNRPDVKEAFALAARPRDDLEDPRRDDDFDDRD